MLYFGLSEGFHQFQVPFLGGFTVLRFKIMSTIFYWKISNSLWTPLEQLLNGMLIKLFEWKYQNLLNMLKALNRYRLKTTENGTKSDRVEHNEWTSHFKCILLYDWNKSTVYTWYFPDKMTKYPFHTLVGWYTSIAYLKFAILYLV